MKSSWKQLDSGRIEARVIVSELEQCFLGKDEFWSKVTTELPVGCYTVITLIHNPVLGLYTLKLMGSPGQPEMVLH